MIRRAHKSPVADTRKLRASQAARAVKLTCHLRYTIFSPHDSPLAHTNKVWLPTPSMRGAKANMGSALPRAYASRRPSDSCTPNSKVRELSATKSAATAVKLVLSTGPEAGVIARQDPAVLVQAGRREICTVKAAVALLPSALKGCGRKESCTSQGSW